MTNPSSNVDTCLVCSRTVPDVVSDNCRKGFTSQVSAVKQHNCNKSHTLTHPVLNKTLSIGHICDFEKKRTQDCPSWNIPLFLYLKTPTHSWTDTNKAWLKYSLNDKLPSCVDVHNLQDLSHQSLVLGCVYKLSYLGNHLDVTLVITFYKNVVSERLYFTYIFEKLQK